jgi:hypothetical protein
MLAMHPHEFVITPFIASAVARAGIGNPHSAVGVLEAARTMGAQGVSAQEHVYWCLGCFFPKARLVGLGVRVEKEGEKVRR